MFQLTQNLKTGKMELIEVPIPKIDKGRILVRNHFSVISAGTEGAKVSTARKSLLGKAMEKPEQVKQVFDTLQKEGLIATYHKVMNKLDTLSPLGYSTAGIVIGVGDDITGYKVGDKVACCGADIANHAEVVSIPENLLVPVPDNVNLKDAAYTTIASIALQGIRQADLKLGESCVVIGLGLIGQLTVQILKAAGVVVVGIDVNIDMVDLARRSGADMAFFRDSLEIEQAVMGISNGYGVDSVIITAATSSLDPVELAGRLCRKKGKVVVVGAVPTGFSRDEYYKKELELRMSTSYGPGRYDPNYEEKGIDYPIGYVRWTENRNMRAFLQLLSSNKMKMDLLTTHTFKFENALEAYQLIMDKAEPYVGIVLEYDKDKAVEKDVILPVVCSKSELNISFIGAGSFAQNSLLPNIKNANMVAVATSSGHTSRNIANKWGFARSTCEPDTILNDNETNVVFIATRHNTHAEYVLKGLRNNKHVFVEKPLCLEEAELEEIRSEYNKHKCHLMLGFNRRFAHHINEVKQLFASGQPKAINYRINAGNIPQSHWIQDKTIGGGRILGEVCHFIDLAMFLSGSLPASLSAFAMKDEMNFQDTLNINICFKDRSIDIKRILQVHFIFHRKS